MKKIIFLFLLEIIFGINVNAQLGHDINFDTTGITFCDVTPKKTEAADAILKTLPDPLPPGSYIICGNGKFRLIFMDIVNGNGFGFNDPVDGPARVNCACDVFSYITTVIDIPNNIGSTDPTIDVIFDVSLFNTTNILAAATPVYPNGYSTTPGFYGGFVYDYISTGVKPDPLSEDGLIQVNFGTPGFPKEYNYCNNIFPSDCSRDFFSLILHEATHLLGMTSFLTDNAGTTQSVFTGFDVYSRYDDLCLFYDNGATLDKLVLGTTINPVLPAGALTSNKIWMYGNSFPLSSSRENQPVNSQSPFAPGTSISHPDGSFTLRAADSPGFGPNYVMDGYLNYFQFTREYTSQELKWLVHMGYDILPTYSDYNLLSNSPPYTLNPSIITWTNPGSVIFPNTTPPAGNNLLYFTTTNCNPIQIDLGTLGLQDNENDPISIYEPSPGFKGVYNIRGCGNGGNNTNQLTLNAQRNIITFTPRQNFIGRAQFAFHLYDGKEIGSYIIVTIDVSQDACFTNTPSNEIIINGDMEEGFELQTLTTEGNTIVENIDVIENHVWGWRFPDGMQYITPGWQDPVIRESYKECRYGSDIPSFPAPGTSPLPPFSGDRYVRAVFTEGVLNEAFGLTLSENISNCPGNYIFECDYFLYSTNIPNPTLILGLNNSFLYPANHPPQLQTYNIPLTQLGQWEHITFPFTYTNSNPSQFLLIDGILNLSGSNFNSTILFDNFSLRADVASPLSANAGLDLNYCLGQPPVTIGGNPSASGGTAPYNYLWTPAAGLSCTNCANPLASPGITTVYTLTVTDACGNIETDDVLVTVGEPPHVDVGQDQSLCTNDPPIQLNATGAINYLWTPSTGLSCTSCSNPLASPSTTITYTVVGTDAAGCSNSDDITITVLQSPVANAGNDDSFCADDPAGVTLNGTGGVIYSWSPTTGLLNPNSPNPVATPTVTTVYTLNITAGNGCTDSDDVTITVDQDCCTGDSYVTSGTYDQFSTQFISANSIAVSGVITIVGPGTVSFNCPDMRMAPGTIINVTSGATLEIAQSWLYPCTAMWQGIVLQPGSQLEVNDYSRIEGSFKAIRSDGGAIYNLENTVFNRNQIDIQVDPFAGAHLGTVERCIFTCRNLPAYNYNNTINFFLLANIFGFYLDNNFSTATLPAPLSTIRSHKALNVTNTLSINFGAAINGKKNIVDYHDYGIFSVNTSVTAVNNRFINITGRGLVKPSLGIAVYAENTLLDFSNSATYTSLKVGGNGANEKNFFRDCFIGVFSLETPSIDIQNNSFDNLTTNPLPLTNAHGLYGIFTRLEFYSFYEVNNNIVNNCETGIHFLRKSKGSSFSQDANILNNDLTGGNTTNLFCNTGILVEDVTHADLQKQINIIGNKSNNAAIGIHTRNVNQVLNIRENENIDIKPNVTSLSYHAGIRAEFCGNLIIRSNEKIKSTNNTDVRIKGIYVTKCSNKPIVVCNKVNQVGQGIVFEGTNGFTFFDNNIMQNCFDGYVLLNNGSIGQQGGPGNPSDNTWVGNFGNSKTYTDNTSMPATHSVIYVRNSPTFNPTGTDNQASSGLPIDTYNAPGAKIVTSGPFDLSCNTQHIVTFPDKKNFVTKLVTESQPMDEFVSGSRWAEKATAFQWIKEDYSIAAGDTLLENFYNNANAGCFGKTDSIDQYMQNGDYASAQILNSLQNPFNQTELNHKDFVQVATSYNSDSLSSVDSVKLFEIAVQCPLEGGYSVYVVRAFLNHYYKNNIWFEDYCAVENRFDLADINSLNGRELILYPNPNDGSFAIFSDKEFISGICIQVVDVSGKLIYSSTFKNLSNQINIHLEGLERGVYFINIFEETNKYHLRFVVSR